jgi:beta-mannosidase
MDDPDGNKLLLNIPAMYKYLFMFLMVLSQGSSMGQCIDLCGSGWTFRRSGDKVWLPASVPGTVHTDLLYNKKIADPFYRNNEKDLQWIDTADWEYKTQFSVDDALLARDRVVLKFEGLDTYADVFLNGEKILQAYNMHRSWKVDVKGRLKKEGNELRIYFHSPINSVLPAYEGLPYTVPVSNNDQAAQRLSVFTRKAGYHYGWDWGPRFVTSGIWRPVTLTGWDELEIEDLFIEQKALSVQKAVLEARVEVNAVAGGVRTVEVFAGGIPVGEGRSGAGSSGGGGRSGAGALTGEGRQLLIRKDVLLYKGNNSLCIPFTLAHPELWWPNGMGGQKLYTFTIVLKDGHGKPIAEKAVRRGLRKIELVQESDERGRSFYFKVNGKPVFMKGANYIPQDNFLPRVTRERMEYIINSAAVSHMNMLRVWGGGVYQSDEFYDLCDEKGILVWQDFMFACSLWPPFEALKQNIYEEAAENVRRLRNHPCIALWCGNNEVVQFFNSDFWGQVKDKWKTGADSAALFDTYKDIFHYILPAAIKANDNEKAYWSTSPGADNFSMDFHPDRMTGDMHYWGVWGGTDRIEEYDRNVPRFMSEYGFQSFPEMATIRTFADSGDLSLTSPVMTSHQRSNRGNAGIREYMKDWFRVPARFDKLIYVGQLLQSEAIRTAIEAHRRAKPYCMGSLFWQIDDCWPAASWSSIDYYGRWKALQYQARRSFSTLLLSTVEAGDSLRVQAVSDSLGDIEGVLEMKLLDFQGKILRTLVRPVVIAAEESKTVFVLCKKDLLRNYDTRRVVLKAGFAKGGKELAGNLYYFEKPRDLVLPAAEVRWSLGEGGGNGKEVDGRIHEVDGKRPVVSGEAGETNSKEHSFVLTLHCAHLARFVRLSIGDEHIIFSDNYFDLLPNQERVVTFRSSLPEERVRRELSVISLIDSIDN